MWMGLGSATCMQLPTCGTRVTCQVCDLTDVPSKRGSRRLGEFSSMQSTAARHAFSCNFLKCSGLSEQTLHNAFAFGHPCPLQTWFGCAATQRLGKCIAVSLSPLVSHFDVSDRACCVHHFGVSPLTTCHLVILVAGQQAATSLGICFCQGRQFFIPTLSLLP